jgi:hypothetical protein
MPSWSKKDRRQFEHIKDSSLDRGIPEERAEEIAGRTVNKSRRQQGRTPTRRTSGTGNPNRQLEDRTVQELRNIAKDRDIRGRSAMSKDELVRALRGNEK